MNARSSLMTGTHLGEPRRPPVALVGMPWGSVVTPSLAMAILKGSVQKAGFEVDLHFLNIRFAERLGLDKYEGIAAGSFFHSEWFFSHALFGPGGSREIRNGWDNLKSQPGAEELLRTLKQLTMDSEELCIEIANEHAPRFIDDCISNIDWGRYMAVGFTTTFAQSLSSLLLAQRIKDKWPKIQIILGGANVDSEMGVEFIRAFPWIDYIVHGEAEDSFPLLLDKIASGHWEDRIPGVSMRKGPELLLGDNDAVPIVDLNQSPVPDYTDYVRQLQRSGFHRKAALQLYFESSRGCWWGAKHHCTFCGLNGTTMGFRKKDPDRVYSEILNLADTYRCLKLNAADNILAMDYFNQLLPKLAEMNTDIEFFYEVKANLSRKQLKAIRAAGITNIQPGIESFNSRLLRLMRKGITAIQNIQLLKWCRELGIRPSYNVLYGFPGETPEDYAELPDIARLLAHVDPPGTVCRVLFERFSPYYFESARFGLKLRPNATYQFIFPSSRVLLDRIAYFFEGEWDGQKGDPEKYLELSIKAVKQWQQQSKQQKIFCYYAKGPNYIIIYDNRPRSEDRPIEVRQICLDKHVSTIYLFCDEIRAFQTVCDMMKEKFSGSINSHQVRMWLDALVFQGLMFREDDRYLSLAVRGKPRRDASVEPVEQ